MSVYADYITVQRLAFEQWGIVTHAQLQRLQIADSSIRQMLTNDEGLLKQMRGVYMVPLLSIDTQWDWEHVGFQALQPALFLREKNTPELAARFGVISRYTAALIHGCIDLPGGIYLTAPRRHRLAQVFTHRAPLKSEDITIIDGLPVTSLERTTRDLGTMAMDGEHRARWMSFLVTDKGWHPQDVLDMIGPDAAQTSQPYFEEMIAA